MMHLLVALLLAALVRASDQACNSTCLSDEVCQQVNNASSCQCNSTMYTNATYTDIAPMVDCNGSLMVVSFRKCIMVALNNAPQNSVLANNSCTVMNTSELNGVTVYTIAAKPGIAYCGNTMQVNDSYVTYSNVVHFPPVIIANSLILGQLVNFPFSCTYKLNMQTSLATVLHPVASTENLATSGNGFASTTMAAYSTNAYTTPIESNSQNLPAGSTLHFGMMTQLADGDMFALRVEYCYATPTDSVNDPNRVFLIQGGCAVDGPISATVVSNGVSLEVLFSVESFAFQSSSSAYIYCSARLCVKNMETCAGCTSGGSRGSADNSEVFSLGPFTFADPSSSRSQTAVSWALLGSSLLALLTLRL